MTPAFFPKNLLAHVYICKDIIFCIFVYIILFTEIYMNLDLIFMVERLSAETSKSEKYKIFREK